MMEEMPYMDEIKSREEIEMSAEKYIELYKTLEKAVTEKYDVNVDDPKLKVVMNNYKWLADDIHYCGQIRNLLQHRKRFGVYYPVEPSDGAIKFISDLIEKVNGRKKCSDIAISLRNICKRHMKDNVKETMIEMKKHVYTHVPIIDDNGVVIGVFDENAIFNYLNEVGIIEADNLIFEDIKKYLSLERGKDEMFLFRKSATYVDDLEQDFNKQLRNQTRLEVVFLTASGDRTDQLSGMITPWDVLGNE